MSLLMQALKKAENEKKQAAQAAEGNPADAGYPSLDEHLQSPAAPEKSAEITAHAPPQNHPEMQLSLAEPGLSESLPETRHSETIELEMIKPEVVAESHLSPTDFEPVTAKPAPTVTPSVSSEPVIQSTPDKSERNVTQPTAEPQRRPVDPPHQARPVHKNLEAIIKPDAPDRKKRKLVLAGLLLFCAIAAASVYFWEATNQNSNGYVDRNYRRADHSIVATQPAPAPIPAPAPPAPATPAVAEDKLAMTAPVLPPQTTPPSVSSAYLSKTVQAKPPARSANSQSTQISGGTQLKQAEINTNQIQIEKGQLPAKIHATLINAYNLFTVGDFNGAQPLYEAALRNDPNNRDALLGSAAVALKLHQTDRAAAIYSRLLDLDPADPDAIAGLTSLRHGDPEQSESQLKQVLMRNPQSGATLFELGNMYGQQSRWSEAQDSYFRAFTLSPTNADYAFNLAVSLDRLGQGKLALDFYQKALTLSQTAPGNFNQSVASTRIAQLRQSPN